VKNNVNVAHASRQCTFAFTCSSIAEVRCVHPPHHVPNSPPPSIRMFHCLGNGQVIDRISEKTRTRGSAKVSSAPARVDVKPEVRVSARVSSAPARVDVKPEVRSVVGRGQERRYDEHISGVGREYGRNERR
jgi:hypothetical protein